MKFNLSNKDKIKISLSDDEIIRLFGSYEQIDCSNPRSKTALNMLLSAALQEKYEYEDKNVIVEVIPEKDGCVIFFTIIKGRYSKRVKKAIKKKEYLLTFNNSNDLIDLIYVIKTDSIEKSSLYTENGVYELIITAEKTFITMQPQIFDYCNISCDKTKISSVTEYHKLICENTAVIRLKKAFRAP